MPGRTLVSPCEHPIPGRDPSSKCNQAHHPSIARRLLILQYLNTKQRVPVRVSAKTQLNNICQELTL